jgi:hypothetical protein
MESDLEFDSKSEWWPEVVSANYAERPGRIITFSASRVLTRDDQRREMDQSSHFSPTTRANSFALDVTSVAPCRRA